MLKKNGGTTGPAESHNATGGSPPSDYLKYNQNYHFYSFIGHCQKIDLLAIARKSALFAARGINFVRLGRVTGTITFANRLRIS